MRKVCDLSTVLLPCLDSSHIHGGSERQITSMEQQSAKLEL